jgi:hypothetical protein
MSFDTLGRCPRQALIKKGRIDTLFLGFLEQASISRLVPCVDLIRSAVIPN